MSVTSTDFAVLKSVFATNTAGNGGRMGRVPVTEARHALFPRVTRTQRVGGATIVRKVFLSNQSLGNETAFGVLVFLETTTNGGDRLRIALGTQTDDASGLALLDNAFVGTGRLNQPLVGGETQVQIVMEASDAVFLNGGKLHISNKFKASQTVAAGVVAGDSVLWNLSASRWDKVVLDSDVVFPKGRFLGSGLVLTDDSDHEEWLTLADNLYTGEVIGTGDGSTLAPTLAAFAHAAWGVCVQPGKTPVLTATCGGQTRSVTVSSTGACSGYCTAGQFNLSTGQFSTPVSWWTAPDAGTNILAAYRENCFVYSGQTATVKLAETVAGAYAVEDCFAGGCLELGDLSPTVADFNDSVTVAGTYNETLWPVVPDNKGAEEDVWTITFSSATAFSCVGMHAGSVGSGVISADFAPLNPAAGRPYFTLKKDGFGGTWAVGDVISFKTHPGAAPLWFKQVVPANCPQEPNNFAVWGWYNE